MMISVRKGRKSILLGISLGCEQYGGEHGVMSPILSPLHKPSRLHLGPWRWSKCSAMKIKQSLGAGRGNCLYKTRLRSQNRDRSQGNTVVNVRSVVPIMIERHQEPELPISTAVLSEHKQCQLIFGRGECGTCSEVHGVVV